MTQATVELWPHQEQGAETIHSGEVSALWWEPRCGKTFTAIHGTRSGDRLIICPNSVKTTWASDLRAYGEDAYIWGTKPKPKVRPRNVIVNYESVWRTPLISWNWDSIIFDESHRLANMRTKLFEHLQEHAEDLRYARVLMLSGTPCPEGYHQLIPQSIVATGQFCGFTDPWEAIRTGWVYDEDKRRWVIQPGWQTKSKEQLHLLGSTMTQAEAGIFTKKLYRTIMVPAGTREQGLWSKRKEDLDGPQLALFAQSCASGRDPKTGEIVNSSKLDAIVEWVKEYHKPVVVLCHFTSTVKYLEQQLTKAGLWIRSMYGDDDGAEYRGKVVFDFNHGEVDAIIANVAVVKVGINLSVANTLIFAENSYSGEARIQAEERLTVKGKVAVEVIDFATDHEDLLGYIDSAIVETVRAKRDFNASCLRAPRKKKQKPT